MKQTTEKKLSLKKGTEKISEAFGYETMGELLTAFKNNKLDKNQELAVEIVMVFQSLPRNAQIMYIATMEALYGCTTVSGMAETLVNTIPEKAVGDFKKRLQQSMELPKQPDISELLSTLGGMGDVDKD